MAYSDILATGMDASKIALVDRDLALNAYRSVDPETPFNMTTDGAKRLGAVIGCDFLLLIKADIQRRNSSTNGDHYEAYAAIYLVSSRTGRLVEWMLPTFEASISTAAISELMSDAVSKSSAVVKRIALAARPDVSIAAPLPMDGPPEAGSELAKSFKSPIPFRRIKPEYPALAALYEIAATVEIVVDLDDKGEVLRTEIVKWAGFGLDESVEKAVRQMSWRPAERNGKFLPMRFLLRYNFKKLEKNNP